MAVDRDLEGVALPGVVEGGGEGRARHTGVARAATWAGAP